MPISLSYLDGQNSVQGFLARMKGAGHPAASNLYAIEFGDVPALSGSNPNGITPDSPFSDLRPDKFDNAMLLSYYANEVTVPSRQTTTSNAQMVGSGINYATGTAFSGFQIQFIMPRTMVFQSIFERWQQLISNDADQYTRFMSNYCCKTLKIFKMDRAGGGAFMPNNPGLMYTAQGRNGSTYTRQAGFPQYNRVSGVWYMFNVFPYNVSGIQLSNARNNLVNFTVSFYYERYRWVGTNGAQPLQGGGPLGAQPAGESNAPKSNTNGAYAAAMGLQFNPAAYSSDFYTATNIDPNWMKNNTAANFGYGYSWADADKPGSTVPGYNKWGLDGSTNYTGDYIPPAFTQNNIGGLG